MPMRRQRIDAAADAHAVLGDLVRRVAARARETCARAARRARSRRAPRARSRAASCVPLGGGQLERVELALVELGGQRAQGGVAPGAHLGDRLARRRLDVGGQLAAAVAERRPACAGSRGCFFRIPGSWRLSFEVRQNSSLRGPRSTEIYSANGSTHLRGAGVRAGGASNGSSASRSLARTGAAAVGRRGRGRRAPPRCAGSASLSPSPSRAASRDAVRRSATKPSRASAPARRPAPARRSPPARRPAPAALAVAPAVE